MNARARRILETSRKLCEPFNFPPRDVDADLAADALRRTRHRAAEPEIVRKGSVDEADAAAAGAAVNAAGWESWLRGMLESDRSALLEAIGEFIADEIAKSRAAFEKSLDRQRDTFAAELKAANAELRSRVTEIATELRAQVAEARRSLDVELRAQCKAIQLENIDRCQALVDRLQAAIGERQAPLIEGEAERQRRPN
jgi:hypothetical protein